MTTTLAPADPLDGFTSATSTWFREVFAEPTEAQRGAWSSIAAGRNALVVAPTGSGKTLAAFLWALDELAREPVPPPKERCRVLYVSPLKALAVDVERNLRAPLTGITQTALRVGPDPAERHGRRALRRHHAGRAAPHRQPAARTSSSPRPSRCSSCSPRRPATCCARSGR